MSDHQVKKRKNRKCRFIEKDGSSKVDYKNIKLMQKLVTPQGKIYSRKRSGACAQSQKRIKNAIKRARFLAILPYAGQK